MVWNRELVKLLPIPIKDKVIKIANIANLSEASQTFAAVEWIMKKSVKMKDDYTVSPGSLTGWLPTVLGPEHMTEFNRDPGSDFPFLHAGLCPDRGENHHTQLASYTQSCITFWKALGDTRVPWHTANWPALRDQPASSKRTAELWALPPVWGNTEQSWAQVHDAYPGSLHW